MFLLCALSMNALAINSIVTIQHPSNTSQGTLNNLIVGSGRDNAMRKLVNYLEGMLAGAYRGTVTFSIGTSTQTFRY